MRPTVRPVKIRGYWMVNRRVPRRYAAIEPREYVRLSTGIAVPDDPRGVRAAEVARDLNAELDLAWQSRLEGKPAPAAVDVRKHRKLLADLRLAERSNTEIVNDLPDLVDRLLRLDRAGKATDKAAFDTVMGFTATPGIRLSTMIDTCAALQTVYLSKQSPAQARRWRLQRENEVNRMIDIVGADIDLADLTRDHVLKLRAYWQKRIVAGEVKITSANRRFSTFASMFNAINRGHQLKLNPIFAESRIPGGKHGQRLAYDIPFIQSAILREGALDGLNDQARAIVYVAVETGMRLSEICNLNAATIRLDAPIPHVQVRDDTRLMKTDASMRDIPLVGVALMALKAHPHGFPRYADNANSASAAINKFLKENDLRPNDGNTVYSFRHSFADRLDAVLVSEKIKSTLMGHTEQREPYGQGPQLPLLKEWLDKIVFIPPSRV